MSLLRLYIGNIVTAAQLGVINEAIDARRFNQCSLTSTEFAKRSVVALLKGAGIGLIPGSPIPLLYRAVYMLPDAVNAEEEY